MSALPLTRSPVSEARERSIRAAVRLASGIDFPVSPSRVAQSSDAAAFCKFLSDPAIHRPIYNLPRPLNVDTVTAFIAAKADEQSKGEGLLLLRFDEAGDVIGYSEFDIWPHWGAGDLGGALRADQQGRGAGAAGARRTFTWMFEVLDLDLIVATGALDNVRTARMLDGLGFQRKGEITNTRPDGSARRSIVWEVTRQVWQDQQTRSG